MSPPGTRPVRCRPTIRTHGIGYAGTSTRDMRASTHAADPYIIRDHRPPAGGVAGGGQDGPATAPPTRGWHPRSSHNREVAGCQTRPGVLWFQTASTARGKGVRGDKYTARCAWRTRPRRASRGARRAPPRGVTPLRGGPELVGPFGRLSTSGCSPLRASRPSPRSARRGPTRPTTSSPVHITTVFELIRGGNSPRGGDFLPAGGRAGVAAATVYPAWWDGLARRLWCFVPMARVDRGPELFG